MIEHKMSKREWRIARAHMIDIKAIESKPPKGVIVFDQDMNRAAYLDEASRQGFYVGRMTQNYVNLY